MRLAPLKFDLLPVLHLPLLFMPVPQLLIPFNLPFSNEYSNACLVGSENKFMAISTVLIFLNCKGDGGYLERFVLLEPPGCSYVLGCTHSSGTFV